MYPIYEIIFILNSLICLKYARLTFVIIHMYAQTRASNSKYSCSYYTPYIQFVFIHSTEMDVSDAVCLWVVYRRMRRRKQKEERKYWVHPILKTRLSSSYYITLYPKLRDHDKQFFNYFRMSIKSFDDLLDLIKNELEANEQAVRYRILPQEKLIVTLR